ncbi:MAG TPA: hypothetical protein VIN08_26525 [Ohtaekwangia sp.]|uniref:hypothetical protein n=1 Tax=Ohtaekwangia sp. TaxID=2066019 RepID=UPI002F95A531
MKKVILIAFLLWLPMRGEAQSTPNIMVDPLAKRVDTLEHWVAEKNYTRIPIADFEKIIDTKISDQVYNSIYKWIAFLGGLIGLVGVFIGAYFKTQIKTDVEEAIKKVGAEQSNKIAEQDKKIEALLKTQQNYEEQHRLFKSEASTAIEEKINSLMGFLWNNVADALTKKAAEEQYQKTDVINDIEEFIARKNVSLSNERIVALIDTLMRCYYHVSEDFFQRYRIDRYRKMIELLNKYEKDFELYPQTYANAAIALSNKYELYGVKSDRDACLDACEKSISRLQDYGLAYAIKMEIFLIDYVKAYDDQEKQNAIDAIRRTFKSISNNNSSIIRDELLERFEVDDKVSWLHPYTLNLEKLFSQEMDETRKVAIANNLNKYEQYGKKKYQDRCITLCNALHDEYYSYTVKLELYCIEYMRSPSEDDQQVAMIRIYDILTVTIDSNSNELAEDIRKKLQNDKETDYLKKYIQKIEEIIEQFRMQSTQHTPLLH